MFYHCNMSLLYFPYCVFKEKESKITLLGYSLLYIDSLESVVMNRILESVRLFYSSLMSLGIICDWV